MKLYLIVTAALLASPAHAETCAGKSDFLVVKDWKVEKVETDMMTGIDITLTLQSNSPKPFRMVDGAYTFSDVLDRRISGFKFDPDLRGVPGGTIETGAGYMGNEMDRVPKMDRSDVIVTTCVKAVVYEDGTKETF